MRLRFAFPREQLVAFVTLYPHHYVQEYLVSGPLGKSGFLAAFSLIFLSEIGDKTFFIAALLAMKVGKWMSYLGSVAALVVMTIISVGIGAIFSRVPDALKSSIPVGELAGVALLVFFGIKALRVSPQSTCVGLERRMLRADGTQLPCMQLQMQPTHTQTLNRTLHMHIGGHSAASGESWVMR